MKRLCQPREERKRVEANVRAIIERFDYDASDRDELEVVAFEEIARVRYGRASAFGELTRHDEDRARSLVARLLT